MADLKGLHLADHLEQIFNEYKTHRSIYGYPADSFFRPVSGKDFSVNLYGTPAYTPLGPAAGPHTQLAHNILLSWLHGSRIIELKTIQVLDELTIPRPCIDMRTIGFNVEWSQELTLKESLKEYVTAWMLIHLLRHSELLEISGTNPFYDTIFDMSAGYDLKGISSEPVSDWLTGMHNATEIIESLRTEIPPELAHLKNAVIPPSVSDSLTLSTFHGCPADEIEDMVAYLITEHHLNVIVKMNPTLGGYEFTRKLLQDDLGYKHIELVPSAFEADLQFDQAVAMMQRLQTLATKHKRIVGAKFTNTLIVQNTESVFKTPQRYLSGAPLYVLAMSLVEKFRTAVGTDFPVSFSGGITKENFPEAVAANLAPVTTCTDLLKKGGYKKLTIYLQNLSADMEKHEARSIRDYILNFSGSTGHVAEAGQQNGTLITQQALNSGSYAFTKLARPPKKINSQLHTFDCLSCNICIPVCPNAANFEYLSQIQEIPVRQFKIRDGAIQITQKEIFQISKQTQIGNLAEFCNECGNCDTFCPETGGPYKAKPHFFIYRQTFTETKRDGYYFENPSLLRLRLKGQMYTLQKDTQTEIFIWGSKDWQFRFDTKGNILNYSGPDQPDMDDRLFLEMKTVFEGIRSEPNRYPQQLLLHHTKH